MLQRLRNVHFSLTKGFWGLLLLFMALTLLGIYVTSAYFREEAAEELARKESRRTSQLVFEGLRSVMEQGATTHSLETTMQRLNEATPGMDLEIHRGKPVAEQYGRHEGPPTPEAVQAVMGSGEERVLQTQRRIRYLYPVKAQQACLRCHTHAQKGDVAGVIDVRFAKEELKVPLDYALEKLLWVFGIVLVAMLTLVLVVMRLVVVRPIHFLARAMDGIRREAELSRRLPEPRLPVKELHVLVRSFNRLLEEVEAAHRAARERSLRDELTGLYNRRYLESRLGDTIENCSHHHCSFSLLLLDLDGFKAINDTYGHAAGDAILLHVARTLKRVVRDWDTVARQGGDEFVILLPETAPEDAESVAERARTGIAESAVPFEGRSLTVGVSVGAAGYPRDGETVEGLLAAADEAMYHAKQRNRDKRR
jgi:diguanylate cyclase (GGDEF)-like protein